MSHVSICFCTRPSLIIYRVDPVYGLILGLPGKFIAASNRHLLVMVCGSVTCHSHKLACIWKYNNIRAKGISSGGLCMHQIKRHHGISEHKHVHRHIDAPFTPSLNWMKEAPQWRWGLLVMSHDQKALPQLCCKSRGLWHWLWGLWIRSHQQRWIGQASQWYSTGHQKNLSAPNVKVKAWEVDVLRHCLCLCYSPVLQRQTLMTSNNWSGDKSLLLRVEGISAATLTGAHALSMHNDAMRMRTCRLCSVCALLVVTLFWAILILQVCMTNFRLDLVKQTPQIKSGACDNEWIIGQITLPDRKR